MTKIKSSENSNSRRAYIAPQIRSESIMVAQQTPGGPGGGSGGTTGGGGTSGGGGGCNGMCANDRKTADMGCNVCTTVNS